MCLSIKSLTEKRTRTEHNYNPGDNRQCKVVVSQASASYTIMTAMRQASICYENTTRKEWTQKNNDFNWRQQQNAELIGNHKLQYNTHTII